jgi:hypothetical protein
MNETHIQFITINGRPVPMTPYNTLITWYKEDMTVDRRATIKSFSQFYAARSARRLQNKLQLRMPRIPVLQ